MASLKLDISGMDGLKKAIASKQKDLIEGVDREMNAAVFDINAKQIAYTPVDTGRLKGGNHFDISKPLNKVIENNIEYAPYIEFGTGSKVNTQGLDAIANSFRGKSSGTKGSFLEMIKEWCKRNGLPESAAYPIMRKISKTGIAPQPFFYRAYFEEYPKMIQRIKKILSK